MTSYKKLLASIAKTGSRLCIGLDTSADKLPGKMAGKLPNMTEFNRRIIDATKDLAASYKINFAFYEQYGTEGFRIIEDTLKLIPSDAFIIADAKRGDIGNTSTAYAKSVFDYFGADSITVSPYMGSDSIGPFADYSDKMIFVLALTSNPGSTDYQRLIADGKPVYMHVVEKTSRSIPTENLGFVVGATHPDDLAEIRKAAPQNALLIPGVGTQGGSAEATLTANGAGPAIVNVSRDIIYAGKTDDFDDAVRAKAEYYRDLLKVR